MDDLEQPEPEAQPEQEKEDFFRAGVGYPQTLKELLERMSVKKKVVCT